MAKYTVQTLSVFMKLNSVTLEAASPLSAALACMPNLKIKEWNTKYNCDPYKSITLINKNIEVLELN